MVDLLLSEIYFVSGFVSGVKLQTIPSGKGEQRNAPRLAYRPSYYVNTG